jgi:hypothetical protein
MRGGRRAAGAAAVGEGGGTEEAEENPTIQATPVSGFTFRLLKIRNLLAIVLDLNPSFLKHKKKTQQQKSLLRSEKRRRRRRRRRKVGC